MSLSAYNTVGCLFNLWVNRKVPSANAAAHFSSATDPFRPINSAISSNRSSVTHQVPRQIDPVTISQINQEIHIDNRSVIALGYGAVVAYLSLGLKIKKIKPKRMGRVERNSGTEHTRHSLPQQHSLEPWSCLMQFTLHAQTDLVRLGPRGTSSKAAGCRGMTVNHNLASC